MGGNELYNRPELSQFEPVNRNAAPTKSAFEVARGSSPFCVRVQGEQAGLRSNARDLAKVLGVIRRDADHATWAKPAMKRGEKAFRHQAARRVAPFGPRVGKQKMESRDGARRQQIFDRVGNLEPEHSRIR